jgi:Ca-activated chloride channel family protein
MNRRAFCKKILLPVPFLSSTVSLRSQEEKVHQAVCCLVDASDSMRSGHNFFNLQKLAIATTLRNPCVTQRLLASEDEHSAFALITWASASKQILAIPWTVIRDEQDLRRLAKRISNISWPYTDLIHNQTGLGMALFAGIECMSPRFISHAARKIINISSNGINNDGLDPHVMRSRLLREDITVNAIIMPGQAPTFSLDELTAYYRRKVTNGSVLVPVEPGPDAHRRFVNGMVSKFCAELA